MENNFLNLEGYKFSEISEDAEFIPLLTPEDEREIEKEDLPNSVPILPLRNTVLFPGVVIPITAGRDKSINLVNDANKSNKIIGVVSQKDSSVEFPTQKDINKIGTIAQIMRVLKMPDGNITVVIQGKKRFEIDEINSEEPYMVAKIKQFKEVAPPKTDKEFATIIESIKDMAVKIIKYSPNIPSEAVFAIKNIESKSFLMNFVSSNMNLIVIEKQKLLEIYELKERAMETLRNLSIEFQKVKLKNDIQSRVRSDLDQQQREYFLNQQLKTIKEELGDVSYEEDILEIKNQAKNKKWNESVKKHFEKELQKFQRMNPQVAEHSIQRNYLDLFLELPWKKYSVDKLDLKRCERILNEDHFGLEKVKQRIIEYLAVLKIRKDMKSPIICFYGPPGVGKTSLGKSIAKSIGREYARISLGGLRDEAEIRGHRKTYIGAMPGRIIQSLKKVGTSNPVFLLDEIDKLSSSNYGDPSSAMLEVLDSEQNKEFYDNFLEIDYDLSKIFFIATSNDLSTIQPALRDRMEIIEISGYIVEEKIQIAKKYLLPKQLKEHGLTAKHLKLNIKIITQIIEGYTRESGVRGLERQIGKIVRNIAKTIAFGETYNIALSSEKLVRILGKPRISYDEYENNKIPGVVIGLAWTSVGGDILFIESILSKGEGKFSITGNLGTVMKESAKIAMEYIKSNYQRLGIEYNLINKNNIHIHVPEGATPKDGPSAGITILTSLVSLYTQKRVKKKLAMTGEITLRGKVLPVGGIKEKILAAKRGKIKEIILSEQNRKDIDEINATYIKGLTFHYVGDMEEVLKIAIPT